jgi:spermidine synthase
MLPWIELDTAPVPDGGTLKLMQRGTEFWIMAGTNPLMTSRQSGSEEALASLALARLAGRSKPRLLIGGLGMGFTLRAALALAPPEAEIIVAEIVPKIIEWARGPLAPLFAGCLDDKRVTVQRADVAALIAAAPRRYDAILLDVDNGPEGLSRDGNDRLYSAAGLHLAKTALSPAGVLAVWSAHPDAPFTKRLGMAGFTVTEEKVRARGKSGGARHLIWLATPAGR